MELWSFLKIDSQDEKNSPGAESREEEHLAEQLKSEPEQRGPAFCFCSCQLDWERWAQMTEYKRLARGQPSQSFMLLSFFGLQPHLRVSSYLTRGQRELLSLLQDKRHNKSLSWDGS